MTRRSGKRSLLLRSPASPTNTSASSNPTKKSKADINRKVHEKVGMEFNGDVTDGRGGVPVDVDTIQERIMTRVNEAMSVGNRASGGSGGSSDSDRKELMSTIVPALITAVSVAVAEAMTQVVATFRDVAREASLKETEELRRNILVLKYENDQLQQYSRRETVRIVGVPEEENEDVEKTVLELFKEEGVDVKQEDISVVHRTGSKRRDRHILVKFVSRKKKSEVMQKRKALKDKDRYKKVFLNDDLTPLRSRLLSYIKRSGKFGRVWSNQGRIFCSKKVPPGAEPSRERPMVVESPDDLFKIGFDSVDLAELGLGAVIGNQD